MVMFMGLAPVGFGRRGGAGDAGLGAIFRRSFSGAEAAQRAAAYSHV
jgi:hypothetical protein